MKYITKNSPPEKFINYCGKPRATYKKMSSKKKIKAALREALVKEQGYICCYCGMQIHTNSTTIIEHIKSQTVYKEFELDYSNLLASCDGGRQNRASCSEGKKKRNELYPPQCDSHKSHDDLPITPLCQTCESRFLYADDGSILCGLADSDAEMTIRVLNLDNTNLKRRRKEIIDTYKMIGELFESGEEWELELARLNERDNDGKFEPFCFVVQSYIKNYVLQ